MLSDAVREGITISSNMINDLIEEKHILTNTIEGHLHTIQLQLLTLDIFRPGVLFKDTRSYSPIFKLLALNVQLINDKITIVLKVLQWKIVERTITIEFEDLDHFIRHMVIVEETQNDE